MQAAPLDEGSLHRADALQGLFAERPAKRFALALLLQTALFICFVEDGLQVGFGQIADAQRAADGKDIVFPVLPALGQVGCTGCAGQIIQPVGVELGHLCGCADDALVQPGVCLGVCFPLAGAAGLGTVEAAALAVLLHIDLPAGLFFLPDGCAGSFGHKYTLLCLSCGEHRCVVK